MNLTIAKVGLRTPLSQLFEDVGECLPDWSPNGDWITFCTQDGWKMISPSGREVRSLGRIDTPHLAFSKDGKRLYGIRGDEDHQYFFFVDLDTLNTKNIKELRREDWPQTVFFPGVRLSVAPDGKSAVYAAGVFKSNLWLLKGFNQPSLLQRLGFGH